MTEFLYQYGLFFAKALTIVIAIVLTVGLIASIRNRVKREEDTFEITDLNEKLDETRHYFEHETLDKRKRKALQKERKKEAKAKSKEAAEQEKSRLFVIRFDGDIRASQLNELRELITAVIRTANQSDEALIVLESAGGFVHQYGLAASQIKRLRDHNILVTVAIDKLAASGGYLMACVANQILAAPFAIVGSIGVLAQLPNFHRLLNKHQIDYEQYTAGEYKRTLTVFGKNTDKARKKFKEDIEQTHQLFKDFIDQNRPQVNVNQVATGEHWHAIQAQQFNLVDSIMTSDEYILKQHPERRIFEIAYLTKQPLKNKLAITASGMIQKAQDTLLKLFTRPKIL